MKTYTQAEAKKKVVSIFKRIEKRFADKQISGEQRTPSGPNTPSFWATRSGFIRTTDRHCSYGYGGTSVRRPFALQVGSLVSRDDSRAIQKALSYAMKRAFGDRLTITPGTLWKDPRFVVQCEGGPCNNTVIVTRDVGTNYSTWFLV